LEEVGSGLFARVIRVANIEIALKIPYEPGDADAVEKRIYERLGTHPFILRTYGEGNSVMGKGLTLKYMPAGTVAENLNLEKFLVARKQYVPRILIDILSANRTKSVVGRFKLSKPSHIFIPRTSSTVTSAPTTF
jgi:hypothetical protein